MLSTYLHFPGLYGNPASIGGTIWNVPKIDTFKSKCAFGIHFVGTKEALGMKYFTAHLNYWERVVKILKRTFFFIVLLLPRGGQYSLTTVRHSPFRHSLYRHSLYRHSLYRHSLYRHNFNRHSLYQHSLYRHNFNRHSLYQHSLYRHSLYRHSLYRHSTNFQMLSNVCPGLIKGLMPKYTNIQSGDSVASTPILHYIGLHYVGLCHINLYYSSVIASAIVLSIML